MQQLQQSAEPPDPLHARQEFRVIRERYVVKDGSETVSMAYGIPSAVSDESDAAQLLVWNRGHWSAENRNCYKRDTVF